MSSRHVIMSPRHISQKCLDMLCLQDIYDVWRKYLQDSSNMSLRYTTPNKKRGNFFLFLIQKDLVGSYQHNISNSEHFTT